MYSSDELVPWNYSATPPQECQDTVPVMDGPSYPILVLGMTVTLLVMVVGSMGNLLTLFTLSHQFYMPRKYRHIKDLTPDTVLIINLAFADLFYSAINLPFMFTTYYRLYSNRNEQNPWQDSETACEVSAFLRYINAIAEWTTLGLMALERCVAIYNFRNCRGPSHLFTKNKTMSFCCGIWLVAVACQMPTLTRNFGEFGYNSNFVKCDFVEVNTDPNAISPRTVFFALESAVPCVLILIGYIVILLQVYSSSASLHLFSTHSCQRMIAVRRSRTTGVIVRLLSVYLVCVIPICIYNTVFENGSGQYKDFGIVVYCIYWLQYCINNFIYVVSNCKYRKAYLQFLCLVTCRAVPLPRSPSIPTHRHSVQVYTVPSGLSLVESSRYRTPSECEEARVHLSHMCPRGSLHPGLNTHTRTHTHTRTTSLRPCNGTLSLDCRHSSFSSSTLSSNSSLQTLVASKQRCQHFSHSFRKDLKKAGFKIRRTFSC